jgi:hypothetical protein
MRPASSGMDAIAQEFRFAAAPGAKNKLPTSSNAHLQISKPPASETFNLESKIRNLNHERLPQTPRLGLDQSKENPIAG